MNTQQKAFCIEYLIDFNASRAYRAAYPTAGVKSAGVSAHHLLKTPKVQAFLMEEAAKRLERVGLCADDALRLLWDTATADANELVEVRKECCRYCYGHRHRYQYTPAEWEDRVVRFEREVQDWLSSEGKGEAPDLDAMGGVGFIGTATPNGKCPECFGEGAIRIVVKDSRELSPAALRLYAGAKQTSNGLEVLTHSRDKNLELICRHFGLFTDKVDHTSSDGSMTPKGPMSLAEFYADKPADP